MKSAVRVVWIALIAMFALGCGGSGGSNGFPFAGAYRSDFTRLIAPDTSILVVVSDNGATNVVISDVTGILYSGSGTTTNQGDMSVSVQSRGTTTILPVTGVFDEQTDSVDIHVGGVIDADTTASKIGDANETSFTGSFSGTYTGTEDGTFDITMNSNGDVTGTAHSPTAGDVPVTGHVTFFGTVSFTAAGLAGGATWDGDFFLVPGGVDGNGSWTIDGGGGTWEGSQNLP